MGYEGAAEPGIARAAGILIGAQQDVRHGRQEVGDAFNITGRIVVIEAAADVERAGIVAVGQVVFVRRRRFQRGIPRRSAQTVGAVHDLRVELGCRRPRDTPRIGKAQVVSLRYLVAQDRVGRIDHGLALEGEGLEVGDRIELGRRLVKFLDAQPGLETENPYLALIDAVQGV